MWTRRGDFSLYRPYPGTEWNRNIQYTNPNSLMISQIDLAGSTTGYTRLSIEASTPQSYEVVKNAFQQAGFPAPDFFEVKCKTIKLSSSEVALITNFIKLVKSIEPNFAEIETEVCNLLHIDLSQQYQMLRWIKENDFRPFEPPPGCMQNRYVAYVSTEPSSVIAKLAVSGYSNGRVALTAEASSSESFAQLRQAFERSGFSTPSSHEIVSKWVQVFFRSASVPRVQIFINMLRSVCNLDDIVDELNRYIASVVPSPSAPSSQASMGASSASVRRTPSWYTPGVGYGFMPRDIELSFRGMHFPREEMQLHTRRQEWNAMPSNFAPYSQRGTLNVDIGANARKLEELGWAGGVPEEYECAITYQLMTNPVYDPNHPRIKFERNAIYLALESKLENPMTRTPLVKEQLISDTELRKEIMYFMQDIKRAARIAYH